jgi:hypothetical protein
MSGYDDDDNKKVDDSDKVCVVGTGCSVKSKAQTPTNHFERLLEEAYLKHTYPIKHMLKDCDMMKNFMTSGSLTQDKELGGDPSGGGTTPFPTEEAIIMVYDGHRISNLGPGTPTHLQLGTQEPRDVKGTNF